MKTGWEKKMSLLNFDQYKYSQCSLLLQHSMKWSRQSLSIFGPAPAGREMCVQCLSESAAAGDVPLLGQSHSTAHAMIQQSALFQALCWESSLENGKLSPGMWLQTQLLCTLFSEAFSLPLFAQVALPAHPALSIAAALPLQPGRSGGSGTEPTQQ